MVKYKILDWAGNEVTPKLFKTFEDAWEYIDTYLIPDDTDDEAGSEFEVIEVTLN